MPATLNRRSLFDADNLAPQVSDNPDDAPAEPVVGRLVALQQRVEQLESLLREVRDLTVSQRTVKEWYTTHEIAKILWQRRRMILATANSKGGVGKTTIAVHLAAWIHEHGFSVTLVDCDPQRSSSEWISEACPEVKTVCMTNSDQVFSELPELRGTTDTIVVDGPAGLDEVSRAILVHADGVIVPCKAGTLEARALVRATKAIRQVQQIPGRQGLPDARVVLTMVGERFLLTREMKDAAAELGFPVASTVLRQRQIYAQAPGHGSVLWKMGSRGKDAALEMDELFIELFPGIDTEKPSRIAQLCGATPLRTKRGARVEEKQQPTRKVVNG